MTDTGSLLVAIAITNVTVESLTKAFQAWNEAVLAAPDDFQPLDASEDTAELQAKALLGILISQS